MTASRIAASALVVRAGDLSGPVLELSSLDLEEIANALADQTDYEHRWLINPQTGEIVFWTADTGIDGQTPVDLDELDLVCIDPLPSWIWYQDMADFAEAITDERAGRGLTRAIQGKGAFRRFKDELHEEHPDLLPAWYAFRDARATRRRPVAREQLARRRRDGWHLPGQPPRSRPALSGSRMGQGHIPDDVDGMEHACPSRRWGLRCLLGGRRAVAVSEHDRLHRAGLRALPSSRAVQ
jgi:Uncharacterised protein family (UPF0158)